MPAPVRFMAWSTCVTLVAVSAYSVALGGNGLLWFAWVVLLLTTAGAVLSSRS